MKPDEKNYKPISCNLYDELTLLIMRKRKVKIDYKDSSDKVVQLETLLKDVFSKEGEEFILLENKHAIRLDRLLKIDGKDFQGKC